MSGAIKSLTTFSVNSQYISYKVLILYTLQRFLIKHQVQIDLMCRYFMFHTYIPTCLIVMMSWISFWIKPEAVPARVTLGVTSLLTLSTQHANSQKSLPPVSYIKAIDMFMSSCTLFVFFSLIEYAIVNVMMGDISDIERKDKDNTNVSHIRNMVRIGQNRLARKTTICINKVRCACAQFQSQSDFWRCFLIDPFP